MTDLDALPEAQRQAQRRAAPRDPREGSGVVVGGPIRRFWASLGPGVVTGAADDDPSGIATYSIAGAQFGGALLWTALFTWPLMTAVQMMCARVGMVTGRGVAGALRHKFPRPVLVIAAVALFAANTINVGSDLAGMADAAELLTGVTSHIWVVLFGVVVALATIRLRYATFAGILKWLALVLLAYIVTALYVGPDWSTVLHDTFTIRVPDGKQGWATLVAILGTTISPYLFFWQASQEVEEEKALGRRRVADRVGATKRELHARRLDVAAGTFFSNVVMFFIILTTALTLHRAGITSPESSRQVAAALTPLAGRFASLLYTLGLVGTGALAIPTLAGSAAYAFAELFGWRQGMDEHYTRARGFYAAFVVSVALGVLLDFTRINPVRALYWTAVINGVLAPFLLVGILIAASDVKIMHGQPSSMLSRVVVGLTALAMFAAAGAMFLL
jgi:NRAMP (natural resistance-associated macrophage protein)-like metal ion transporter